MLVINRVELQIEVQLCQMRHFNNRHAVLRQELLDPADETVQIGNMSEDVAGQKKTGQSVLLTELPGQTFIKEIDDSRDAAFDGGGGNVLGRFDAQDRGSLPAKLLEHGAIVAGRFD